MNTSLISKKRSKNYLLKPVDNFVELLFLTTRIKHLIFENNFLRNMNQNLKLENSSLLERLSLLEQ